MAESAQSGKLHWFSPPLRGIIPLDGHFHVPKKLLRFIKQKPFLITANKNFLATLKACAEPTPTRPDTWINAEIEKLYTDLHQEGHAHSIEVWNADQQLVGGLYGVSLGSAFFGESMFSRATNASKTALVYLVAALRKNNFTLLDSQFLTAHLAQFGAMEIPKKEYHIRLKHALTHTAHFQPIDTGLWDHLAASVCLQPTTQIS